MAPHESSLTPVEAPGRPTLALPLWPGLAAPDLRVVFPKGAPPRPRPALVVFRGGGYATSQGSGKGSAEWAAEHGMVGLEVAYRTQASGEAFPKNYADAARSVRLARARATEWGIDPARVGVLGYSAGGHLASLLSTQPGLHVDPADDQATISARPDFVLLAYPVISFTEGYSPSAFAGSAENFLGKRDLDEATRRRYSNERHVASDHPPVFVWTTADDELVPAAHAQVFVEACKRASVPVTFKLYPRGPHGLGLALGQADDVGGWTNEALAWLRSRGVLAEAGSP